MHSIYREFPIRKDEHEIGTGHARQRVSDCNDCPFGYFLVWMRLVLPVLTRFQEPMSAQRAEASTDSG